MRRFGLIGYPLTHSFSQKYFTEKFAREGITGCVYENFSLEQIGSLKEVLGRHTDLRGLNVTIPYKKQVLAYLTDTTPEVQKMGACNCIKIVGDKLTGYNTDVFGFETSLLPFLQQHHRQALVLGSGGAAAAVVFVLDKLRIPYRVVSREASATAISYDMLDAVMMASHHLIINTTPLGMFPAIEKRPGIPYQYLTPQHHLYDLIYNPAETKFLELGHMQGATTQNGAQMLLLQAEESWRIWNS